jgi:hypothetical protein
VERFVETASLICLGIDREFRFMNLSRAMKEL